MSTPLFSIPVVPWVKIAGKPVHTNGFIEDALGLTPLIRGWCRQGFYTHTADKLKTHIASIDWRRVQFIHDHFEIKARGYIVMRDGDPVCFVTERRYQRLLQQCFKITSSVQFDCEVTRAFWKGQRGNMSGQL